ncbi:hypothetical protein, partial [Neisseria sp.]
MQISIRKTFIAQHIVSNRHCIDGYGACCPEDIPMALFLSIFPIILLIWLMVKKNSMPSYIA